VNSAVIPFWDKIQPKPNSDRNSVGIHEAKIGQKIYVVGV